ncbi:unnamed protein product, partial [marine sediment metagenome]
MVIQINRVQNISPNRYYDIGYDIDTLHKLWEQGERLDLSYYKKKFNSIYIKDFILEKKKILLLDWTHRKDNAGGVQTQFSYLKRVFPDAELVATKKLFGGKSYEEFLKKVDNYLINRYKENKNLFIIRDAETAGILDISKIPQVTTFGNPYKSIRKLAQKTHGIEIRPLSNWIDKTRENAKTTKKIAVSNYMAENIKRYGIKVDEVIPNCVDTDIFKPLNKKQELRKKYKIPDNKRVAIWVGIAEPELVKNFQMLLNLISCYQDIFWILVT